MLYTKDKILVHLDTSDIKVYSLKNESIELLLKERSSSQNHSHLEDLANEVDAFLGRLSKIVGSVNNRRVRLYATGIYQKLSSDERDKLVIDIFVNHGLYLNIISSDLEQFYREKSSSQNIIEGLLIQEFRNVVICGSFQQYLDYIGETMKVLQNRNICVLSPWTTKVVPETLGTDFILLEGQEPLKNERDAWKHKYIHMNKFRQADAIIVCNPDGLVGKGTMFEFGFMVAYSKRIIFTDPPEQLTIPFPYEIGLNF